MAIILIACAAAACYAPRKQPARAEQCGEPPAIEEGWRHRRSRAVASLGAPHHAASDPIAAPGEEAVVEGKFAYGTASKDLEDESVSLWLRSDACAGWTRLGDALTDGDGRVRMSVSADLIAAPGAYDYRFVVAGDGSRARGRVWVMPRGTEIAVFDIDGTLTTGDDELVEQTALGNNPAARPGACRVARAYAGAGYVPVYVTGRPYMYRNSTLRWLEAGGFPPGPVITTDRLGDAVPSRGGVGAFKLAILEGLENGSGLSIVAAYGNAKTDICAYHEAGIDSAVTFIVGPHAGKRCGDAEPTQPIRDYREHAAELDLEPAARRSR